MYWNEKRNLVQINLVTPYDEQGIENSVDEVTPFN